MLKGVFGIHRGRMLLLQKDLHSMITTICNEDAATAAHADAHGAVEFLVSCPAGYEASLVYS